MAPATCPGLQPTGCLPWPADLLLDFSVALIWPCQAAVSGLGSLILATSHEKEDLLRLTLKRITLGPVFAAVIVLFLPVCAIAVPLRCALSAVRKPFQYSVVRTAGNEDVSSLSNVQLANYQFGIASGNICLLPEFLSRINNLSHTAQRARTMVERMVVDQFFYTGDHNSAHPPSCNEKDPVKQSDNNKKSFEGKLATHFPHLDFFCCQEVFDWNYNKIVRQELHKVFPYIIHDVGVCSLRSNLFLLNSGLLFASRHPVLNAEFKPFKDGVAQELIISKGLLMVKVLIGEDTGADRKVGYIFDTHLQAFQGTESVIVRQLDEILEWTVDFKKQTADSRDVILFDILCGDFNFDNISPCDKENAEHRVFDVYHDPCRIKAGKNQPWSVGTEFRHLLMYESTVTSPDALKVTMADPVLRHRHFVDANIKVQNMDTLCKVLPNTDEHGNIVAFPEGGMRRVDYIVSRKDVPVDISTFQFVTRFTTLTDHIPVAMTFRARV